MQAHREAASALDFCPAASDVLADAPNAAVLALRIASHPHAEEERRRRARALIETLIAGAPDPVGTELSRLAQRFRERERAAPAR